jgi:hypothetical protein
MVILPGNENRTKASIAHILVLGDPDYADMVFKYVF